MSVVTSPKAASLIAVIGVTIVMVGVGALLVAQGRHRMVAHEAKNADGAAQSIPFFNHELFELPNDALAGFVAIPGGAFTMGSNPEQDHNAFSNERWSQTSYQGTVTLPTFFMGKYEVTVAQYQSYLRATRQSVAIATDPRLPATSVSWTDALRYTRWLDAALRTANNVPEGLRTALSSGWHVVLPSEAEWEKAARGTDGRIYPWGNHPDHSLSNVARGGTVAVGSMHCDACTFGLQDMSGNVWELTRSPWQDYPYDSNDLPHNPANDALFVMRGGSYQDADNLARAAVRGGIDPGARTPFIGFRIALTPP